MLNAVGRRIFLATGPMDMRRGIDKLAGWVESQIASDPFAGDVFVFVGRDRRRVKVLVWDTSGWWLCMKRLDRGRFSPPPAPVVDGGVPTVALSASDLQLLLEGVTVHAATYRAHGGAPGTDPQWHSRATPDNVAHA